MRSSLLWLRRGSSFACAGALLCSVLAGCGGDDREGSGVGLRFGAASSALEGSDGNTDAPPVMTDEQETVYRIREARVHLRDIELDLPDGVACADVELELDGGARCDDGDYKVRIPGPFVIDLVTQTATPDLSSVRLPAIAYRRIDLRVDDADEGGLVSPGDLLFDHSWVVRAGFTRGDQALELLTRLSFSEDIRIEQPGGVEVDDGADLLVVFDAARWLQGVRIDRCIAGGDVPIEGGVVRIDEDSHGGDCSDVEGDIKENLKRSGRIERDD